MNKLKMKVNISYAWWFPVYLNTLYFMCETHKLEPNQEAVSKVLKRAIKIKLAKE